MSPKLYMVPSSPPVRSVLLTAKALGISLELIPVNFLEGEHLTSKFLKINLQHTLPTLDDDGLIIWDSHAINAYLVTKYGKDSSLYPNEPFQKAVINQRLQFDTAMFNTALKIIMPNLMSETKTVPKELADKIIEDYQFLEKFLEGNQWMVGDDVTLADLSLLPTVTSIDLLVPIAKGRFPHIINWIKRAEELPYYSANKYGLEYMKTYFKW